jgi:hypothetical protein
MRAPNRLFPKVLKVTLTDYETVSHDDRFEYVDSQVLSELEYLNTVSGEGLIRLKRKCAKASGPASENG